MARMLSRIAFVLILALRVYAGSSLIARSWTEPTAAATPLQQGSQTRESKPALPPVRAALPLDQVTLRDSKARALANQTIEQWTIPWTDAGCDVSWGEICEGELFFEIPKEINGVKKNLEYCSHTAVPNPSVHSFWRETEVSLAGVKIWMKSVGGPIYDQYGASIKFGVTIHAVTAGLSNEDRKQLGCQNLNVGRPNIAACTIINSSQKQAIYNCLRGASYTTCAQFSDLKATRCVKDRDEANWFFNNTCSNELYNRYDHLFITDTKLCK